jgi:hypothetical protein
VVNPDTCLRDSEMGLFLYIKKGGEPDGKRIPPRPEWDTQSTVR